MCVGASTSSETGYDRASKFGIESYYLLYEIELYCTVLYYAILYCIVLCCVV